MAVKKAMTAMKDGAAPKAATSSRGTANTTAAKKTAAKKTAAKKTVGAARTAKAASAASKVASARSTVTKGTTRTPAVKTPAVKSTSRATVKSTAKTAAVKSTAHTATAKGTSRTPAKAVTSPTSRGAVRKPSKATQTKVPVASAPLRTHKIAASSSTDRTQRMRVRKDETPWTAKELDVVRAALEADVARLGAEIETAEHALAGLMRDAGDGAGDDQADAGTKTFEREQEISLANNAREMYEQSRHALERIAHGSYGICESCGNPIGKNRLLAFPRATLCVPCKSKQERR